MRTNDVLAPLGDLAPIPQPLSGGGWIGRDPFARRAGPDVSIRTEDGVVWRQAIFSVDPATHQLQVAIVDQSGRLLRTIPAESIARMLSAMAAYGRR
ncbi:MAG TPA: hypothetical protein VF763_12875 [Candidatus Limnocylindrales bacterium]